MKSTSTTERGRVAEQLAVDELQRRGFRIVERNFRCRAGEIDIVARDGGVLVFVEVRSRRDGSHGTALETVGAAKQSRIVQVAQHYLSARRPRFEECRFDVVGITSGIVTVVCDAFRLGD